MLIEYFPKITGLDLEVRIYKETVYITTVALPEIDNGYYAVSYTGSLGNYFVQIVNKDIDDVIAADSITNNDLVLFTGVVSGTPTTSTFACSTASATDNFYKDSYCVFNTGPNFGSTPRKVSSYNGTSKTFTFTPAWLVTPVAGNSFTIVGKG
jgi:hypothetical protein